MQREGSHDTPIAGVAEVLTALIGGRRRWWFLVSNLSCLIGRHEGIVVLVDGALVDRGHKGTAGAGAAQAGGLGGDVEGGLYGNKIGRRGCRCPCATGEACRVASTTAATRQGQTTAGWRARLRGGLLPP